MKGRATLAAADFIKTLSSFVSKIESKMFLLYVAQNGKTRNFNLAQFIVYMD